MSKHEEIKLFETSMVRTFWDDEQEKWYFCINDVVGILTDSVDIPQYIKRLRSRDEELNFVWGTICTPHQFISTDGKKHSVNCTELKGIFRIIQSIPSKKAEPFKQWMAAVAAERGGGVARVAKEAFEQQTGKAIVTSMNAKQYLDAVEPRLELEETKKKKTDNPN